MLETDAPVLDADRRRCENIHDAIRYTFCAEPADYQDAYWNIKGLLEAHGYKMIYSKNHWRDDPEYKGINTRWVTPAGQRFELQFHTPESFHAKQRITHNSYERVRNPLTSDDERGELAAFQREVSSRVSVPAKARDIPEHFTKGPLDAGQDHVLRRRRRATLASTVRTDLCGDLSSMRTASRTKRFGGTSAGSSPPAIVEWKRGDFTYELVEVSHAQASKIIEYFREQWGPFGQPLDS